MAGPAVSAISQGSPAALMKQAQLPFAGFLAGPLSWVLNEDVPEPRQGHFELASDCAGVCVFLSQISPFYFVSLFFDFFFKLFLFLAVLGLCCCTRAFL